MANTDGPELVLNGLLDWAETVDEPEAGAVLVFKPENRLGADV